jgi:peptide/nickel transport system substrate-binding protein
LWVQSDPLECLWTAYTGGWISTEIDRDGGDNFSFYYTSNDYPIPLFQSYAQSPEFDEVALKLRNNDFTTLEERDELFQQAMEMALNDPGSGSVRVWINDSAAFGPQTADTMATADLAGGVSGGRLWPFTARFVGQEGGVLRIAQPGILVEPWNPLAGSNWVYDAMVQRATQDFGTMPDPYTGLRWPQRIESATVVAKEGLPIATNLDWVDFSFAPEIPVPAEAWSDWNAVDQVFITAGEKFPEGTTANSKVTVCYPADLFTTIKWHDGSPMTVGDFVYGMIMTFDPGKEDSAIFDEALKSTLDAFLGHFKGVQITSTDPLCIDTYEDLFAIDAENNVADTSPVQSLWYPGLWTYGTGAWHNITLGALAEEHGDLAFSTDKATAKNVEWTSFVAGPSLEILAAEMEAATAENYIPYAPTMSQFVTADEATARWANLGAWYAARNNFWIGNGPFMLYQVYPVEGTVTLQRFSDYPDMSNKWASFGEPKLPVAELDGPGQVAAGEEATFDVFVTYKDQPYPDAEMTGVTYLVFDAVGGLVTQGEATLVTDGQYQVVLGADVTGTMASGSYKLEVAAVSSLITLPGFATLEFIVP